MEDGGNVICNFILLFKTGYMVHTKFYHWLGIGIMLSLWFA